MAPPSQGGSQGQGALFDTPTAPKPAKKPARTPRQVARTTDTGQTAPDLVNAWAGWLRENADLPLTPTLRGMTLRTVKQLIVAGATSVEIQWSLAYWIAEWASRTGQTAPTLSAKRLEEIWLNTRAATSPTAATFRQAATSQVQALSSPRNSARTAITQIAQGAPQ